MTDSDEQAEHGREYVRERYLTPAEVWDKQRKINWYSEGGTMPPDHAALILGKLDEAIAEHEYAEQASVRAAFGDLTSACRAFGNALRAEVEPALTRVRDWLSARLR